MSLIRLIVGISLSFTLACEEKEIENQASTWALEEPLLILSDSETKVQLNEFNQRFDLELSAYDEISFHLKYGPRPHLSSKTVCGPYSKHVDQILPNKSRILEFLPEEVLFDKDTKNRRCQFSFKARGSDGFVHEFATTVHQLKLLDPQKMIRLKRDQDVTDWFNKENLMQTEVISNRAGYISIKCDQLSGKTSAAVYSTFLFQMILNNNEDSEGTQEHCQLHQYSEQQTLVNISSVVTFRKQIPGLKIEFDKTLDLLKSSWAAHERPRPLLYFYVQNVTKQKLYIDVSDFYFHIDLFSNRTASAPKFIAPYTPITVKGLTKIKKSLEPNEYYQMQLFLPFISGCFSDSMTMYYRLANEPTFMLREYADAEKKVLINEYPIVLGKEFYLGNNIRNGQKDHKQIVRFERGAAFSKPSCPAIRAF